MKTHSSLLGVVAILASLFVGCGDSSPAEPGVEISVFTAVPETIAPGDTVEVSWETANAASISLERAGVPVVSDTAWPGRGSASFVLTEDTTFDLVATGSRPGDTIRRTAMVTVVSGSPRIVSFTATPDTIDRGGSAILEWKTLGAERVRILDSNDQDVTLDDEHSQEGTVSVSPAQSTRFKLLAENEAGTVDAEITVTVNGSISGPPVITSFSAAETAIPVGPDAKATALLSWEGVIDAATIVLEADTLGVIDLEDRPLAESSIGVEISSDTLFTLTAQNEFGEESKTVSVRVILPPTITALTATPNLVVVGESAEIAWSTNDATSVSLTRNGELVPGDHPPVGTLVLPIFFDSTFELTAFNELGTAVTESISVAVGNPLISSFIATPGNAWVGAAVLFSWETLGGTELTLSSPAGVVCTKDTQEEILAGSCLSPPFTQEGSYAYTLELKSPSARTATRTVLVQVGSGPQIVRFSMHPAQVELGTPVTVEWDTLPDPDGEVPTLVLSADRGGPYTLSPGSSGSMGLQLPEAGTYSFALRASTKAAGSLPATSTQTVEVLTVPVVDLRANPPVANDDNRSVTLSWTSAHASRSLRLYRVDGTGAQVLLIDLPSIDRAAGSLVVTPSRTTTYRLIGTDDRDKTRQAEVTVTVQASAAKILTFVAVPPTYPNPAPPPAVASIAGDPVTLNWTTKGAVEVQLDLFAGLVSQSSPTTYADINSRGATTLPLTVIPGRSNAEKEGYALLTFPSNFTFPFGGSERNALQVYSNGVASFDTSTPSFQFRTYENDRLGPETSNPWAHLCPFWDNLQLANAATGISWIHERDPGTNEQYLIVQWTNAGFEEETALDTGLNFQVVLYESGKLEYRYGAMLGGHWFGREAEGASATIGVQAGGPIFNEFSFMSGYPGGFENKSFQFSHPQSLDPNGSYSWTPEAGVGEVTRQATLTAMGLGVSSRTLGVAVHPRAVLAVEGPEFSRRNEGATISWTSSNATAISVVDRSGATRCTAQPAAVATGSCEVAESIVGLHSYDIIATGALGHQVVASHSVMITSTGFGIRTFGASANLVDFDAPVTLSWETAEADRLKISVDGIDLVVLNAAQFGSGTFTIPNLKKTTDFVMTIGHNVFGEQHATRTVSVRSLEISVTPSATEVAANQPVTLSWAATSLSPGPIQVNAPNLPMVQDTSGTRAFVDIKSLPGTVVVHGPGADGECKNHDFSSGFTFPYLGGDPLSKVAVSSNGYVNFIDQLFSGWNAHSALPNTAGFYVAHLAPFWDDMHSRTNGRVYAGPSSEGYVIQWSKMSTWAGSAAAELDLNFQIVLHQDGTFDFRYGDMYGLTPPATASACNPNNCEERANGQYASIGYQNLSRTEGHQVHLGQRTTPYAGGLSNRTFRYELGGATGSVTVMPKASADYVICAFQAEDKVCKTTRIEVR